MNRNNPISVQFFLFINLAFLLLSGCTSQTINETAYPYFLNEELLSKTALKKVIVANENFGSPSKKYLRAYESTIDQSVVEQLEAAGFEVADRKPFEVIWRQAVRKHGNPYDRYSSQLNTASFRRVVVFTLNELKETTDVDAVVFTDLLEHQVTFASGTNRLAKWHGVSRRPRYTAGHTLSESFNWSQTVPAASLRVIVYTTDAELLFKSFGGLEVSRELNARKERFTLRSKLFNRSKNVQQGVRIALHPLIPFE